MSGGLIHVAGIRDTEEAELLIDCGVEYLGFPLVLDHHAEDLPSGEAAKIVAIADRPRFSSLPTCPRPRKLPNFAANCMSIWFSCTAIFLMSS